MFVLYRKGYEICGVGTTPDEARADAASWLDGGAAEAAEAEIVEGDEGFFGGLYISGCTDRLAEALSAETDDAEEDAGVVFDWNEDGLLDLMEDDPDVE